MSTPFNPKPGIYHDVENEIYHSSDAVSNSGLSDLAKSPYHYWARRYHPNRPPSETKAGQLEGTLAHCAILEPDFFDRRYRVGPDVSRATKEWKSAAERAEADGMVLIKPDQYEAAMRQGESVRSLPCLKGLLDKGNPEVSAWAHYEQVYCRVRPDWVADVSGSEVILLDVKTYTDASPEEFARQVARKAYYRQDAYYRAIYGAAAKVQVLDFIFIAVETSFPYVASATGMDDRSVARGMAEFERLLRLFAQCHADNHWPAYGDMIETAGLPRWVFKDEDGRQTPEEAFAE